MFQWGSLEVCTVLQPTIEMTRNRFQQIQSEREALQNSAFCSPKIKIRDAAQVGQCHVTQAERTFIGVLHNRVGSCPSIP
jgi:hypothetical protein